MSPERREPPPGAVPSLHSARSGKRQPTRQWHLRWPQVGTGVGVGVEVDEGVGVAVGAGGTGLFGDSSTSV